MTDIITIKGKEGTLRILGQVPLGAKFLLKKTIEDIGDRIEQKARDFAPNDPITGSTGALKADPVIREKEFESARIIPTAFAFGGGLAVRGRTGFIGVARGAGDEVAFEKITINTDIPYAKFVHEGTGIYNKFRRAPYGPKRANRMVFFAYGRRFALKSVRGQKAQPYLQKAYDFLNAAYIPARIETLRAQIRTIT